MKEETKGDLEGDGDGPSSHASAFEEEDEPQYEEDDDIGNYERSRSSHSEESLARRQRQERPTNEQVLDISAQVAKLNELKSKMAKLNLSKHERAAQEQEIEVARADLTKTIKRSTTLKHS